MTLIELAPGVTLDEIAAKTEATYRVALNHPAEAGGRGLKRWPRCVPPPDPADASLRA